MKLVEHSSDATRDAALCARAERVITDIWREVLDVRTVSSRDNFFDLGGNSLLMVKVYSRLRTLGLGNRPIVDLFRYSTIELLVRALRPEELSALAAAARATAPLAETAPSAFRAPRDSAQRPAATTSTCGDLTFERGTLQRQALMRRTRVKPVPSS